MLYCGGGGIGYEFELKVRVYYYYYYYYSKRIDIGENLCVTDFWSKFILGCFGSGY